MAEVALVVMGNIQMHLIGQALYFTLDRRFVHVKKGQVNVRGTAEHIAFFQKRTAQIGSHNATVIADALVDSLIGDLQQGLAINAHRLMLPALCSLLPSNKPIISPIRWKL